MAGDGLALLEVQAIDDGPVIHVTLLQVGVPSSKMGSDETKACIVVVQPNAHRAFVSRHPAKSGL